MPEFDDDLTSGYLTHRDRSAQATGPLAEIMAQYGPEAVAAEQPQPEAKPKEEPAATEPQEKPGLLQQGLSTLAWLTRPFGALQEAAIAPIAKNDYRETSVLGLTKEVFQASGSAFVDAMFPNINQPRPNYEGQILDREFPDLPANIRPAAEAFMALVSDPAMLAFPFMKSIRQGLQVGAMQQAEHGPWRQAVENFVSIGPTKDEEAASLRALAQKADSGDSKAGSKLIEAAFSEEDKTKLLETRAKAAIAKSLGDQSAPLVSIVPEEKTTKFLQTKDRELGKYAININLNRVNTAEDVKQLLDETAQHFAGEINEARRGVQSNELTAKLAEEMNMHPVQLLQRRAGQAFNAEEALAARQILVSSGERLMALAQEVRGPEASNLTKITFRKQLALHKAVQEQVSGMTAEAGRALQQFNIPAGSTKLQLRQLDDIITAMGDQDDLTGAMADAILSLKDPAQVAQFAREAGRATTGDILLEVWINSLLSGPQTHAVNSISNSLVALWQIPERLLAAGVNKAFRGNDGVQLSEALGQAYGMLEGAKDGLKAFWQTAKTEQATDVVGKLDLPRQGAISADRLGLSGGLGHAVDYLGRAVRLPGTLLTAEDSFFKSVGYRMELHARAFRQVAQEGLSGKAAALRMQEIITNPPDDIHLAAIDASHYQTFTQPLQGLAKDYQNMANKHPVLRVITPFIRTPTNIMKYFGERSPYALISKTFLADINAGGARRDLAIARMALGSTVMAATAVYAAEGRITGGGPADKRLKGVLHDTGWQPYSIKIGNRYVSYARLEPLGSLLGIAADLAEISGEIGQEDAEKVAAHLAFAVAKNITSKTYLRGLSEAVAVLDDPVRYGEQYIKNLGGTVIPTGMAQAARINDPVLRDTKDLDLIRSMLNQIRSRVPGYSDKLPPRRNLWGEPIQLSGGLGPDIISPFYATTEKDSPASEAMLEHRVKVDLPARHIQNVDLTPDEYDFYTERAGKLAKAEVEKFIATARYAALSDGEDGGKATYLQKIVRGAREQAQAETILQFPELQMTINQRQRDKIQRFKGALQ